MNVFNRARNALAAAIAQPVDKKPGLLGSLWRIFSFGNAVWTPRRYDKLTEVGFQMNIIGYKAVTMVSRAFAGIPIGLYDADGDEIEDHPVLDLLRKPNPWQSGRRFRENMCGYYCLAGNA